MQHKINFMFDAKGGIDIAVYCQMDNTTHLSFCTKLGRDVYCKYTSQKFGISWSDTEVEHNELDIERTVTGTKEALEQFVQAEFFLDQTRDEFIEDYGIEYAEMLDAIPV